MDMDLQQYEQRVIASQELSEQLNQRREALLNKMERDWRKFMYFAWCVAILWAVCAVFRLCGILF